MTRRNGKLMDLLRLVAVFAFRAGLFTFRGETEPCC